MNVLILGSGGREHALSWKIAQSPLLDKLFVAPGNAGTGSIAQNVEINTKEFNEIGEFCLNNQIELIVVGPEDPLVQGIVDYFRSDKNLQHIKLVGPDKKAAQLEGSKEFSKKFMMAFNIPTASYQSFELSELSAAKAFLKTLQPPYVLKADGLAAGKGVIIANTLSEAEQELSEMLNGKFGEAGKKVVIEEFLEGIEFSVFVLTDGNDYKILPVAKDYKRIGEGDTGLNTGGMGAVSPPSFVDDELMKKVEDQIIKPTIRGIAEQKMHYRGFIFFGLIKVGNEPKVIEYNVRMGDPETEVVIPRLKSDLLRLLLATANGDLEKVSIVEDTRVAATVMTVSEGYPGNYAKGKEISGVQNVEESIVFHAGTTMQDNKLVTNGGRVMAFTSCGKDVKGALEGSYASIKKVCFEGITFRSDIGYDL